MIEAYCGSCKKFTTHVPTGHCIECAYKEPDIPCSEIPGPVKSLTAVKILTDFDGNFYTVPNDKEEQFTSHRFSREYLRRNFSQYLGGRHLEFVNRIQLYAELK